MREVATATAQWWNLFIGGQADTVFGRPAWAGAGYAAADIRGLPREAAIELAASFGL
jgi:hypothetical protein